MLTMHKIVLFVLLNTVISDKVFKSVPVTVKTYENDTVLLPCYIDESEAKLRVRWYKDNQLLGDSADPHHLLPPRTRMHANYSLQVDQLGAGDTADYTCEIIRPEPWGPIRQTHTIEVQYSPTIRTIPDDGFVEAKKGEYVDIGCEVGGTPTPIVDWRKNVLCTLSFLATGSYQRIVGVTQHLPQRTTSRCISEVVGALNSHYILKKWIVFPQTQQERSRIRQEFQRRFHLPGVIGCIDCTHIAVVKPVDDEHLYFNRKGYHSLNVQMGEPMALLEHRSRIRFKAEHRLLAGVYECTARNGVGDPVKAAITVVIHDAPVVTAERSFVHTAVGLRAALEAKVEFSVPPARVQWFRDGRPISSHDDRVVMMVKDNVHQLIFRSVRLSDLGNYTFRAQNQLGMADLSFKLTGVPNAASFKVDAALNKATSTSFTLIWEVDSYSNIIEYNLWLRPYYGRGPVDEDDQTTEPSANLWRKVVVPGDSSDGPIHSARYTVRGLTPSTVYEAIVTSRNRFGWSKQSATLHFATEPGSRRPTIEENSEPVPLLEEPEFDSGFESEAHNITQAQVFGRETSSAARESPSLTAILVFICYFSFG